MGRNGENIRTDACRRMPARVAFRVPQLTRPGRMVHTMTDTPYRRAPELAETLKPTTMQWLASLPATVRPKHLPIKFVRIANRLSDFWRDPVRCSEYFQQLLIDRRGGRQGLPNEVGTELALLQDYFETKVHASPQTVWDQIAGHRRDE